MSWLLGVSVVGFGLVMGGFSFDGFGLLLGSLCGGFSLVLVGIALFCFALFEFGVLVVFSCFASFTVAIGVVLKDGLFIGLFLTFDLLDFLHLEAICLLPGSQVGLLTHYCLVMRFTLLSSLLYTLLVE